MEMTMGTTIIYLASCSMSALIQSVSGRYYEFLLIPIGVLMVLILSLKPFVAFVNRIIAVKPAAENTEPKRS